MGRRGVPELKLLAVVIVLFRLFRLHETLTNSNFDTNTICQLSHGSSFKCRYSSQFLSRNTYFADCFTDWHNILNEDVHVTLCLEQEHAGYYDVNSTLDGNPSDIRAFDCSCI